MNKMFFYPHHSGVVCTLNNKNIPFVPFSPQLDGSFESIKNNLHVCTPNPGNLIHSESPSRIFKCDISSSSKGNLAAVIKSFNNVEEAAKFFEANYDALILSFANDIRIDWETNDHILFASLIEIINIKVFAFGLGLQQEIDGGLEKLKPGIIRLLNALNEKSSIFGVRGFTTEKWLRENGIKKAVALGCPSMYRNPRNILTAIDSSINLKATNILTAGYAHSKERHSALCDFFLRSDSPQVSYIFQNDLFAVFNDAVIDDKYSFFDSSSYRVERSLTNKRLYEIHKKEQPFKDYYFFMNSFSWFQCNSMHDLFIGDRLHAAICALLAGTPAVLLYEDIRVKEIADFYGIPSLSVDELKEHDLSSLKSKYLNDRRASIFRERYLKRLNNFFNICEEHGLSFIEESVISELCKIN